MAAHTTEQRAFIVGQLAAYVSPSEIVTAFRAQWKDTDCTLSDVSGCIRNKLDGGWQAFFDQERETFLAAPTADKRVRVAELHRLYVFARDRQAVQLAAEFLEQIAKEESGFYAGKSTPAAPNGVEVTKITRTIVDPSNVDNAKHS